ncbi:hypothetical protein PFISCL1PPCAC_1827 [Pristionchus fissidentatus]|uniref:Regulator of microtubule dynamics protein 1 n=1 Tax=Pristionchus fissidentatus TaxID=1538716 RepID=A0AAV5UYE5_9BILA|nr:hypothetical protein PFISCL1PPCAC_1827 [Pristionchus fissidentatus]
MTMEAIDKLLEEDKEKALKELRKLHSSGGERDAEILWRIAAALFLLAANYDKKDNKRKELILEGRVFAQLAAEISPDQFKPLRWAAILTGAATDYLATKEKIEQGYVFKSLLDKALALDPTEFALLHMRGRFSYSVAELSWIERKVASTLYSTPPTATIDEALRDFLAANEVKQSWIENLFYIGKCYIALKDTKSGISFLQEASSLTAENTNDKVVLQDAKALLKKHSS